MFIVSVGAKICVFAVRSSTHTPSIFVGVRSQWIYRSVFCTIYFFFETKQKVRKQRNTLFPHSLRAKDKHTTSSNLHQLVVYQLSSSVFLSSLEPLSLSSTCDWNAQKDGFLDQSWIIEYNNHQTVGNMLGLCTHWKCMSQPFLLLLRHCGYKK